MPATDIRLVIFDLAGTTLDFGCLAPAGAFIAVFAEWGVEVPVAEARGPMGLHKKDHLRAMLRGPTGHRWRAATGRDWAEADVDELYRRVTPMQVAAARTHAGLCPGVLDCVAELRAAGMKVAASTGYFTEAAAVCYRAAAGQGFVPDFTICADDVPAGRPAPWMTFRCMEALDIYPPSAVACVGDTAVDMRAAKNAGCLAVGVIDSGNEVGLSPAAFAALGESDRAGARAAAHERLTAAGADGVVTDLGALVAMLSRARPYPGHAGAAATALR